MQFELTQEYLDQIKEAIASKNVDYINQTLGELHSADIAAVIGELDIEESEYLLNCLDRELGAEIIRDLEGEIRKKLLKNFSPDEIAWYFKHIDSDDAVDILNEQPIPVREEVIAFIKNQEKADHIRELLHYEEDVAGGLMQKELVKANLNWTVTQCIEEIRRQSKKVEKVFYVYVVDDHEKLLGIVSLKKMLLADEDTLIADIYEPDIHYVESYREAEEVAQIMEKYDIEAIPVVNVHGKLLGRITIDDVVDVIKEEAKLDMQAMAGISESTEEDANVWRMSWARLPWLLIGMSGGILGARFLGLFESTISLVPAMAFFIPLITATGGNVGIQSSSVVVQALANKNSINNFNLQKLFKGFLIALINGIAISSIVFLFNMLIGEKNEIAIIVSIALFSVVMLASLMGTITPVILDKFGFNPALASGPFITTANDLLGLGVYFLVAHLLFNS
ncbi:MAG: magnesium transporter [Cytophagaceae bacterium]|nr:magnesium transporter [Cytophagaceae bacterium]